MNKLVERILDHHIIFGLTFSSIPVMLLLGLLVWTYGWLPILTLVGGILSVAFLFAMFMFGLMLLAGG